MTSPPRSTSASAPSACAHTTASAGPRRQKLSMTQASPPPAPRGRAASELRGAGLRDAPDSAGQPGPPSSAAATGTTQTGGLLTAEFIDSVRSKLRGDLVICRCEHCLRLRLRGGRRARPAALVFAKYERAAKSGTMSIAMMLHLIAEGCVHEGEFSGTPEPRRRSSSTLKGHHHLPRVPGRLRGPVPGAHGRQGERRVAPALRRAGGAALPSMARGRPGVPVDDARNTYGWPSGRPSTAATPPTSRAVRRCLGRAPVGHVGRIRTDASRVEAMQAALRRPSVPRTLPSPKQGLHA